MASRSAPLTNELQPEFDNRGNVRYWLDARGVRVADAQGNPLPQSWTEAAPAFGRLHPQLGQLASAMQYAVNPTVNPQEKMRQAMMVRQAEQTQQRAQEAARQATTPQSTSVADGRVSPVTSGKPQSSGQPYPSGDYEPIVANGKVVGYRDLQTGRTLSTRDVAPVTWGQPSTPQETPAMPAAAPTPATAPAKGKPAAKGAGKAKAAAAELAALKAMSEGTSGAAGAPPSPSTQQSVPMTPSGRPDYNYYADMMNAVDSNDAYYRDFVRLRNDARMAARQAQIRGERFQFVPLRDYKSNRVYLVNADGTDVVLNMDDPQDQKQYQRMVSDLGIDSNRLSDWTDRSSRTLARYFMPQGMQDTTPDFGFLPRRPMVDESKAAPAAQPKEPGMPMPETQGEPSPMGLSLARGPMPFEGQQLRMPGAKLAFSELELSAMGYRQPSAAPPATPPASRQADVMPTTPPNQTGTQLPAQTPKPPQPTVASRASSAVNLAQQNREFKPYQYNDNEIGFYRPIGRHKGATVFELNLPASRQVGTSDTFGKYLETLSPIEYAQRYSFPGRQLEQMPNQYTVHKGARVPLYTGTGRTYPEEQTVEQPVEGIDPRFKPVVLPDQKQPPMPDEDEQTLRAYLTPRRGY